jgi:uncharacterized repeat protein (TIGR04138 family)
MSSDGIENRIRAEILETGIDTRHKLGAYLFVLSGFSYCLAGIGEIRHVNGSELSRSLLEFAVHQYGPLARSVFADWGINATEDFGTIVYNLIDIQVMGKEPGDRREDFTGVADIDRYFAGQDYFEIDKKFIKKTQCA